MFKMTSVSLFLVVLLTIAYLGATQASYCEVRNCYGYPHTMCYYPPYPAQRCGHVDSVGLSPEDIEEVVDIHNKHRDYVARGLETRGAFGGQPAGHIPPLKWDPELAVIAQTWANQCQFRHDTCRNVERFQVGQNLAYESWPNGYYTNLTTLVNLFYDEVEYFDARSLDYYTFDKVTGHYTQLIWGKTTTIGCGLIKYMIDYRYGFTTYLVCNYGPAGNYQGQRVYDYWIAPPTDSHQVGCPQSSPDASVEGSL